MYQKMANLAHSFRIVWRTIDIAQPTNRLYSNRSMYCAWDSRRFLVESGSYAELLPRVSFSVRRFGTEAFAFAAGGWSADPSFEIGLVGIKERLVIFSFAR